MIDARDEDGEAAGADDVQGRASMLQDGAAEEDHGDPNAPREGGDEDDDDADADADADVDADADGEDVDPDAEGDADDGEVEAATRSLLMEEDEDRKPPVEVVHEPRAAQPDLPTLAPSEDAKQPTGPPGDEEAEARQSLRINAPEKDATLASELPMDFITAVRAPIFSLEANATLVSPTALLSSISPDAAAAALGLSPGDQSDAVEGVDPSAITMSTLFPELPLYSGPSLPDPSKVDRRYDEGSLNQPPRLTHVSRLLDSKPILVSTLNPGKMRARGAWRDDSEWMIVADQARLGRGNGEGALDAPQPPGTGECVDQSLSGRVLSLMLLLCCLYSSLLQKVEPCLQGDCCAYAWRSTSPRCSRCPRCAIPLDGRGRRVPSDAREAIQQQLDAHFGPFQLDAHDCSDGSSRGVGLLRSMETHPRSSSRRKTAARPTSVAECSASADVSARTTWSNWSAWARPNFRRERGLATCAG